MSNEEQESYRDSISTVDKEGKRVWVFPKKPSGKFFNYRKWVSYFLLAFLFGAPHIKIAGEPLLLFNLLERKFVIFGKVFWPQDFHIFALAMIVGVVFVILFTVIYGRIFCGWVCPQTIFMEMVFRRIEYWIDGDWTHQKKLKSAPWNFEKIWKRTLKHVIFYGISFLIANTFLAYILGAEELWKIQIDDPANHIGGLVTIVIFTFVFYAVFAFLREQVCTTICPYGRLQGVLLDKNSIVVAYDHVRGENRSKFKKNEDRKEFGKGDCIDCIQCVHVCPTGIDIRNGTQLECVNCTACIDACDHMMEGVGMQKGLIRFVSEEGIKTGTRFTWTKRTIGYTAVLSALVLMLAFLVITRKDFEATILRTRGTMYQKFNETSYSNIYDLNVVNKTNKPYEITLKIEETDGEIQIVGNELTLKPQTELKGKFLVIIDRDKVKLVKHKLTVGVYGNGELIEKVKTKFVGPAL
jgi:cytochrome c oxidase accessory protein FixG